VEPLEDYRLLLTFDNGERRVFDVTPYLDSKLFAPLRNPALFKTVRLNPITIEWIGNIDIAPEELYIDSVLIKVNY
jgi:hypothetical protein